jgi:hypothetical protein
MEGSGAGGRRIKGWSHPPGNLVCNVWKISSRVGGGGERTYLQNGHGHLSLVGVCWLKGKRGMVEGGEGELLV